MASRITHQRGGRPLWSPAMELRDLSSRISRLFGPSLLDTRPAEEGSDLLSPTLADWVPRVNITETDDEYRLTAELPAIDKDDVEVHVQGGVLSIEGERRESEEESSERSRRVETYYGSFARRFTLPDDADPDRIEAKLDKGMLSIRLPKLEPKAPPEPKAIEIE